MYTNDQFETAVCPVCGNELTPPSRGGCRVCWHGLDRGLLVYDSTSGGGFVHRQCLDYFDVETVREYEKQYID